MWTVYVLELADECYYVGRTQDLQKRYQQHADGKGSDWTQLHRPIEVRETHEDLSPYDEDRITKEYMALTKLEAVLM